MKQCYKREVVNVWLKFTSSGETANLITIITIQIITHGDRKRTSMSTVQCSLVFFRRNIQRTLFRNRVRLGLGCLPKEMEIRSYQREGERERARIETQQPMLRNKLAPALKRFTLPLYLVCGFYFSTRNLTDTHTRTEWESFLHHGGRERTIVFIL